MTEKDRIKNVLFHNTGTRMPVRCYDSNRDATPYATIFLEFRISDTSEVPFISLKSHKGEIWAHHNAIYVFPLRIEKFIECTTANHIWTALGGFRSVGNNEETLAKVVLKGTTYYVGNNITLDADFNVMYIKTIVLKKTLASTERFIPKKAIFRINKTVIKKNDPMSKQIMNKILPMIPEKRPETLEFYDSKITEYSYEDVIGIPSEIIINDMPWDIRRVQAPNLLTPQMQASLRNRLHNSNLSFFNGMNNFALDEDV